MPVSPMSWYMWRVRKSDPTKDLNFFFSQISFQLDHFPGYVCSGLHNASAVMQQCRNMMDIRENVGVTTFSN